MTTTHVREWTLPSPLTAPAFGKVSLREFPQHLEVRFTILMPPQGQAAEGWQTGVALDGSHSMVPLYGHSLRGTLPPAVADAYRRKGWLRAKVVDGRPVESLSREGQADALRQGHLVRSDNEMEALSRRFISYLADELDADGGTTVIYWACGDGAQTEVLGDFTGEACKTLALPGPKIYGQGTSLLPAVRYFVERFAEAPRGMYVFLTDGRLDDMDALKQYSTELAREIEAGRRHRVKFVLVGIGDAIDQGQLDALDNLDTGTDVDLWDHKISHDLRDLIEIFAEVVDAHQLVAPTGTLYDDAGRVAARYADGLPVAVTFQLPLGAAFFELEVGGRRIRQPLAAPPAHS